MYVHMYVCMYLYMYIWMYVYMYVYIYVCRYVCMQVCTYGLCKYCGIYPLSMYVRVCMNYKHSTLNNERLYIPDFFT
jgi:hypothetical protein